MQTNRVRDDEGHRLHSTMKGKNMKRIARGPVLAVMICALLSACATSGTRVSSNSEGYKSMARGQQWWCSTFGCGCTIDGQPATCSLVEACLNSGNCQRAP
jgi:uncharacterized protein YceK